MKTKLNHLIGSFCLIAALAATGCSDEHEYASDHSYYDDVKLKIDHVDKKNVLAIPLADETYSLSVTVIPEALSFNSLAYVYEVGDNSIATVDKNGKLTLLKPGETTLTIKYRTSKSISADCTLKVVASLIRDVVLSPEVTIGMEEPVDLAEYVTVMPWSADAGALTYTVKEGYGDIVKIVEGSLVQGMNMGEAVIEIRSTDGLDIVKELKLVVKGSIPIEEIKLNDKAAEINGQTLLVGQEFDLSSLVTFLPENAADKRLKYEVISGTDCISISEEGILMTTAGGEAEIQISPLDEELNVGVSPLTLKFTIKSWNERENWKVTTSITYGSGRNYVKDGNTGNPEHILDDDATTYLSLVKPGKTYGTDVAAAKDVPLYFVVDMGMKQSFNYFTWAHRTTNSFNYLRAWGITMYGSDDGVNFSEIKSNIVIPHDNNTDKIELPVEKSTYRYIKVQYIDWSDLHIDEDEINKNGGTIQVAEFNVGMK
jgi:hypothetical protein